MIKNISINGIVEEITNTEFTEISSSDIYLTGESLNTTIENIQNDYNIVVNLGIGPGIAKSEYGWTYTINDGKYYIIDTVYFMGNSDTIIIPSQLYINNAIYDVYGVNSTQIVNFSPESQWRIIIDYGISVIGNSAFSAYSSFWGGHLTSITIPESVTTIGDYAFAGCSSLTSIIIPNSVTSIGYDAFANCTSLTSITFAEESQLTSIESSAFAGCTSLTSITIPDSVESIGYYTFEGCSSLTSITFAEESQLTSIGWYAFEGCSSLTSIIIPDSVISIGDYAFNGCSSLIEINVDEDNESYSSLDGVLFNKNKTTLLCYSQGKEGSYTIPEGVTWIGNYAFNNCTNLTSITIPNSVINIGNDAFEGCSSLTSINVDEDNESLSSLDGVLFNKNKTILLCYSQGKEGIYTIPEGVKWIESSAFDGCSSLTSITIPEGVTWIGSSAFYNCSNLTSIIIPNSVTSIESSAFANCTSLISITLPNSVTSIGWRAFLGCSSLISITIPDSVTSIGDSAFVNCSSLISITFAEESQLTSIGNSAFSGCSKLISITIPDSVTSIGDYAFSWCVSLTSIIINSLNPPSLGDFVFSYNYGNIYVPAGSVNAYQTANGWSTYSSRIFAKP
jgi:hypothetical protein